MWASQVGVLIFLLSPLISAGRYFIDPTSCKGSTKVFIEEQLQNAFTLARVTRDAVNKSPIDPVIIQSMNLLFGTVGEPQENADFVKAVIDGGVLDFGKEKRKVKGLLSYNTPTTDSSNLSEDDLIVYCDSNRLLKTDNGNYYDTDIAKLSGHGAVVNPVVNREHTAICPSLYPWLTGNRQYGIAYNHVNFPAQITFCPWYLRVRIFTKWQDSIMTVTKLKPKLTSWIRKLSNKNLKIDELNLYDVKMFHELTHTRHGGDTIDVETPNSYGWRNCRRLARKPRDAQGGVNNADTYAFFSLVCLFHAENFRVTPDGIVTTQ